MLTQTLNRADRQGIPLLKVIRVARAEELTRASDQFLITPSPDQLYSVAEALKTAGIEPASPKLTFIPENTVSVTDEQTAAQVLKLCDALDDLDDVMNVHANFDIPENHAGPIAERPLNPLSASRGNQKSLSK
jgi:transcriptional/translational regulatory protein YebC/TACO1